MFKYEKKIEPVVIDPSTAMLAAEKEKMLGDRDFWSDCVSWLMQDEVPVDEVIRRSDLLLAARRERFPV